MLHRLLFIATDELDIAKDIAAKNYALIIK
jgi:hypothetical protein